MATEMIETTKLVCECLELANIPYMLTGSFAASSYSVPRMTRDVDIVVQIFDTDLDRFYQVFEKKFYIEKHPISEAIMHKGMFNIIHNDSLIKIDFILRKDSPYREIEFQRRQRISFYGQDIWIVAPEDLIISKLWWAKDSLSEMQIKDVKKLFQSVKNLDKEYIHQWIETLGLKTIYEKVHTHE